MMMEPGDVIWLHFHRGKAMSDAKIAAIGRQLAEALSVFARERTSTAGVQAQKDIARLQWELVTAVGDESAITKEAISDGKEVELVSPRFVRGDDVYKTAGDYTFTGKIAFSGYKLKSNALRYVVEDQRGLLMIMNEQQLRTVPDEQ
jgi:hypothetical protein